MSPAEVLERVEAAGVVVGLSDTAGRLSVRWPSEDVAREFRPLLLDHRSELLEALAWGRCERCGRRARRLLRTYWGARLCPECVAELVAEFDASGTWPAEPPEWGPAPNPRALEHLGRPPTVADRLRRVRRPSPRRFTPRPGPPPPAGPLRPGGSADCPACRASRWTTERLCGPHGSAWARGVEAARRAREVAG